MVLHHRNSARQQAGFTLIELLVVIAIIGILASIVLVSLTSARTKSRDAKREAELQQIQTALELFVDKNSKYPTASTDSEIEEMNSGTTDITPYIDPIPKDPTHTGTSGYRYYPSTDRQSYTILVNFEKNSGWCSITGGSAASGVMPGYSGWNNSDGTHYPPCY